MKKDLYIFILLVAFPAWAYSNTLSFSSVSGYVGDTVTVSAALTATDDISALQMTLALGEYLHYVSGSATLSTSQTKHQIGANSQNGTLYINIFNFTGDALLQDNAPLFSFRLVLGAEPQTFALSPEVLISDKQGKAIAVSTIDGSVTTLAPKLEVLTKTLNYGHIPIRSTYTQTLSLRNIGNEPLSISGFDFSAAEFSTAESNVTIPAGASKSVSVDYAPTKQGAISERLIVRSNAVNGLYNDVRTIMLVADPFSVNELHVSEVAGISDDTVTVTLRVNNMEPLVGAQVSFTLPDALEYVAGSATPCLRATEHTAQGVVNGNQLTLFIYSMQGKTFSGDDGDLLTFRLRLNGATGAYFLQPADVMLSNVTLENMTSAYDGNYVSIQSPRLSAPTSCSFGEIDITTTATARITLRNYGHAPLTIERISFLQDGFRIVESLPMKINAGANATLTIAYSPSAEGNLNTAMQIYSNDPTNRMHTVTLSGRVYEPNGIMLSGLFDSEQGLLLNVGLSNFTPITGIQCDLHLPEGVSTTAQFEASTRLQGMSATMLQVGENTYRIVVYSLSNKAISAGSGVIGTVQIPLQDIAAVNHQVFYIDNIFLSDQHGTSRQSTNAAEWTFDCSNSVTVLANEQQGTVSITIIE